MTMLAIDTATDYAGVAFYNEQGVLAEQNWKAHKEQTAQLVPVLQELMKNVRLSTADLTGLAVSIGPGSFNGLRVGLGTAKAMAVALNVPLYGVSSLDALAWQHQMVSSRLPVWAALTAGRGRLAVASYRSGRDGSQWRRISDYRNVDVAEFCDLITSPSFVCGELTPTMREEMTAKLAEEVTFASPAANLRRAAYMAELAWQRQQEGDEGDNIAEMQAIYLASPTGLAKA